MYKNTRVKVISPDGETDLFDILADVLQWDTLEPYTFVIVLNCALRMAVDAKKKSLLDSILKEREDAFDQTSFVNRFWLCIHHCNVVYGYPSSTGVATDMTECRNQSSFQLKYEQLSHRWTHYQGFNTGALGTSMFFLSSYRLTQFLKCLAVGKVSLWHV